MKKLIAGICLMLAAPTFAEEPYWELITDTNNGTINVLIDVNSICAVRPGVYRLTEKTSFHGREHIWPIRINCAQWTLDGAPVGPGSVADMVVEFMCREDRQRIINAEGRCR